jgi:transcriptional regulator with XRE-family HTH domain
MKQPDLGLKIIELRQSKGLTQEELVKKCNLSVRTLQRIESGKVIPRGYTLKLISDVLDFNFFGLSQNDNYKNVRLFSQWTNLLKKGKELFNLKTNTMKKLTILSLPVILTAIIIFTSSIDVNARNKKIREKDLVGTWQLCSLKDSLPVTNYNGRKGQKRYKLITPETFMVVDFVDQPKKMYAAFMGAYNLKQNVYTEFLQYTGSGYEKYLGSKNSFDIYIEDGFMFIKGNNNSYNEIWMKIHE